MGRIGRTYPREGTYIACEQRNVRAAYALFAGSPLRASDVLEIALRYKVTGGAIGGLLLALALIGWTLTL
ncbi:MAG TPA: hypothetical protein VET51_06285 [Burkholderiales bacterium]|nr:hypothetical protein [Burkholderiales bacterium]